MQEIIVDIRIEKQEWLRMYRGETKLVRAITRDGRSVQFPANILSSYTSHDGVNGSFRIVFDAQGKFYSIEQI